MQITLSLTRTDITQIQDIIEAEVFAKFDDEDLAIEMADQIADRIVTEVQIEVE